MGGWRVGNRGWVGSTMQCPIFGLTKVWRPLSPPSTNGQSTSGHTLQICRGQYSRSRGHHNVRPFGGPGALEGLCVPTCTHVFLAPCRPTADCRYFGGGGAFLFLGTHTPHRSWLCHKEGLHQHHLLLLQEVSSLQQAWL